MSGKTGTTESNMSSAFLGYTNTLAGSVYIFGDTTTPGQICTSPLRPCADGNLFGGTEPARTWYRAITPHRHRLRTRRTPAPDPRYSR